MTGNRLAKIMARHGLCSRRQAEKWIADGRVKVNGKLVRTPAFNVVDSDKIEVDGTSISERKGTRVWLYHKPAGFVVTENDPEGRPTVFEEFAKRGLPRVLTIGRLDINTEGLLLLTNDGGLKRVLELPATGWLRRYRVRAHGSITQEQLDRLENGISVDGIRYGAINAKLERIQGGNVWLVVALSEGKNREIKNVLAALGLQVNRLIRTSFGPFQLGDIPVGGIDTVKARVLQDQLGQRLAKKAGVDFEAPMPAPLLSGSLGERQKKQRSAMVSRSGEKPVVSAERYAHKANPRPMGFRGRRHIPNENEPSEKDAPEANLRKVYFSDGRAAEMFEPQAKSKRKERVRASKGFKVDKKSFSGSARPDKLGKSGKKTFSSGSKPGGRKSSQRSIRGPGQG